MTAGVHIYMYIHVQGVSNPSPPRLSMITQEAVKGRANTVQVICMSYMYMRVCLWVCMGVCVCVCV